MVIDAKFEKISKYAEDDSIIIPFRKTQDSAGYDFFAAEDIEIKSVWDDEVSDELAKAVRNQFSSFEEYLTHGAFTLEETARVVKEANAKLALVPTGIKCKIPEGYYLKLCVRSSLPLKHWLILGNGIGVIDGDYYNNPDNEGHIYFQIINLLPFSVKIQKGECFGQGILEEYHKTSDDRGDGTRVGGFGSTNE